MWIELSTGRVALGQATTPGYSSRRTLHRAEGQLTDLGAVAKALKVRCWHFCEIPRQTQVAAFGREAEARGLLSVPIYEFTVYDFKNLPNRDHTASDDRQRSDSSYNHRSSRRTP